MANSTVIDAALLSLAGITDANLISMLVGKTIAQAGALYLDAFRLAVATASISRGAIKVYSLDGQSVETDIVQARQTVEFLRNMRSSGGPISMPVWLS